jgi:hypothetical protein
VSLFRRAGSRIARLVKSSGDPAASANAVQLYAKDSAGTTKLFMRDSAGTVTEVGSGGGGGSVFSVSPAVNMSLNNGDTPAYFYTVWHDHLSSPGDYVFPGIGNFAPGETSKWVNITVYNYGAQLVGGLDCNQSDGCCVTFCNMTTKTFSVAAEDPSSYPQNRFVAAPVINWISYGQSFTVRYDGVAQRWRPFNQSSPGHGW